MEVKKKKKKKGVRYVTIINEIRIMSRINEIV